MSQCPTKEDKRKKNRDVYYSHVLEEAYNNLVGSRIGKKRQGAGRKRERGREGEREKGGPGAHVFIRV